MQITYLEGLGLPTHWVCNLAARVPAILGRDPQSDLRNVVEYIQSQGVPGLIRALANVQNWGTVYWTFMLVTLNPGVPSSDGGRAQVRGQLRVGEGVSNVHLSALSPFAGTVNERAVPAHMHVLNVSTNALQEKRC